MPGPLFHVGAVALCPHGIPIQTISSNTRVLVNGMPVATLADQFLVSGCPFNVSGKPQPCLRVQWLAPAARVLVNGQPAILQTSSGLCLSPESVPNGPANPVTVQPRVVGS